MTGTQVLTTVPPGGQPFMWPPTDSRTIRPAFQGSITVLLFMPWPLITPMALSATTCTSRITRLWAIHWLRKANLCIGGIGFHLLAMPVSREADRKSVLYGKPGE